MNGVQPFFIMITQVFAGRILKHPAKSAVHISHDRLNDILHDNGL